jgi:hypothetical protein
MRSLRPWKERVAAGLLIAASLAIAGAFAWQDRHALLRVPAAPAGTQAATSPASEQAARLVAVGSVDTPADEAIIDTQLRISGWALAPEGIERVEIRVDGRPYVARYGIARPDVASVKSGYPDSAASGFEFSGDFSKLDPVRHAINVVAIDRSGRETVLARKSLVPPAAMSLWSDLLDQHPALANRPFRFLMMTSGVAAGGAAEADSAYRAYVSRTTGVGIAVPILYLRTTKGAAGDWEFDPDFDLRRKCKDRVVAEDNLHGVIQYAIDKKLPVQFILNGGIWADASCDTPEWDINDKLEQDVDNCQWTQDNKVFPDDYLKNLPGSTNSPELARTLTYNAYATKVRAYKRRNLQAAARIIADFAREHPDLFVGASLDADTYMNPFFIQNRVLEIFDYNPGMLKQFRHWLAGTGPYAGKPEPGAPDLSRYRRPRPLSLADVNGIARKRWTSWDQARPINQRRRERRWCGTTRGTRNGRCSGSTSSLCNTMSYRYGPTKPASRATGFFPRKGSSRRMRGSRRLPFGSPAAARITIRPASRSKDRFRGPAISAPCSTAKPQKTRRRWKCRTACSRRLRAWIPDGRSLKPMRPISKNRCSNRITCSPITHFATCSISTRRKSR